MPLCRTCSLLAAKFRQLRGRLRPVPLPILARSFAGLFFSYYITERLMPPEVRPLMGDNALDAFVDIYLYGILDGGDASRAGATLCTAA